MYADINKHSGTNTEPFEHLQQSIGDILLTPLGSRIMRRHYGSELFSLIDAAHNATSRVRLYAAVATALARWEPRLHLMRVQLADADTNGRIAFEIDGYAHVGGQTFNLQGVRISHEQ